MPEHYKALVVTLGIMLIVLGLAKPIAVNFMAAKDFALRRNIWLCLVAAAFLVSNYWLFVLIAAGLLIYGVARDSNPAALYLFLLLAVPPFQSDIPTFGLINQLFPLDHLRLMSFVVLLPAAISLLRALRAHDVVRKGIVPIRQGLTVPDILILLFCLLQFALWLPYDTAIASTRRIVLFLIDILLPYFVLSRACTTREMVRDAMASFALAAMVLACIAVFESLRSWLLFASIADNWGTLSLISYLRRGDSLRSQVTGGHSIVLGYSLAIAFGFWLFLRSRVSAMSWQWLGLLTLVAGLGATWARGPWVGALAIVLLFQALGPNAARRSLKTLTLLALVGGIFLLTPWAPGVVDRLPFIGNDDEGSVGYRQQLAALSWLLIQQHPFFGTLDFMKNMEELRQGEGIIDLVNAYAGIALSFGLVGLALFAGLFGVIATRCFRAVRRLATIDPALSSMGANLLACVGGGLMMIATVGLYLSVAYLTWAVAGLTVAYARLVERESFADIEPSAAFAQTMRTTNQ